MTSLAFGLTLGTYLAFCGAAVALILAPGPDTMYVLARGLDGRESGVRSAFGIATGVLFHTSLAALGVAALFRAVPEAATALQYVGAAYLVYLGVVALRNDEFDPSVENQRGASFRRGVLVNALNPKVALFFLAFLPGFASRSSGAGVQMAFLGATYAVLTALYLSVVALGADRLGTALAETRVTSALNYVGAGTMLLLGIVLALE
ncbi:LysE family translocator [Haloferax mediterranei ATCC 33500]|uniref:LysE family translocator n=1 Tax=Haloferax mediterranei (strain ATCC 33500 / DSM 1411 / JCM 8866 / NBRC 14739 / NCIMB 2177 / R-4) TaxID=523841 RepID=I3R0W4_HALMT|nr:LysE family translocator [Haloferax mediterranei]AFK17874.1 threonine/homoserine/homoserine lactone efflux protein [Haloferax mediterranei ATCC 33500]AHZ22704.1 lysine transporter LysE [Haloferax mediterranei ATCC 33500]EMA02853.1 threonine/homoserine/homoserine lactone efflux protein [Haloferax mediterranei ATCC 33500]MDX5987962.1 LysE family translocator [Haloferax mediterranei ATCC 33500]QCQ74431.1 LysE family translocator [Haloferax mediterranei ATCC 33500]